ncbi:MAG: iron-containing alcohol dehydrogenase [Bacteroidota bacterium]|nr:iron-containing alcohol dehydrogenase [Bacteroidota bacterium]
MNRIKLNNPSSLVFGAGCINQIAEDYKITECKRFFIITIPPVLEQISSLLNDLSSKGIAIKTITTIKGEPSFSDFEQILSAARDFQADSVAGIGGGSVMDVSKLVAALFDGKQQAKSVVGTGLIKGRHIPLICAPTTSGTGSEVSPNAILLDEEQHAKLGIISPWLVPDKVYVDPSLTRGLPPQVTAFTGIDALTHCIEAYTNRFAHPMVDTFALEGIRLISTNLKKAYENGNDLEARSNLSLGSVYGGMCLGPVNTAAVHALAYPLGSDYKIAHGISNALMLTYIMEFNLSSSENRYANIARGAGISNSKSDHEAALESISFFRKLIKDCGMPLKLSEIGISYGDIKKLAESALLVQRLLKNNPREISLADAESIYQKAY